MVVVPNIPMLSATSQSKHAARFLRLAMASIMDILKVKPFVEVSVGQLLWGYEDPLIKLAKDVVPNDQKLPYEQFGLLYGLQKLAMRAGVRDAAQLLAVVPLKQLAATLASAVAAAAAVAVSLLNAGLESQARHKNGTSKDRVTIFTGASDITRYGLIDRFNGNSSLTHWKTPACNRLDGSDGSIFPPHIKKSDTIYVYDKDLCRILPLVFESEVETAGGVPGYRFTPPLDVFGDTTENPENECFCPGGPPCAPSGFFNVSLCQYDSPVLLSFPHFYLAPERYRLAVEGISPPKKEDHQFFLDVQPQMGVSLRARARVQINLAVSQVVDIKQVATFPDIIFPIMWFEDGINELPTEVTSLLSLATRAPPIARAAISYGLFAVGALLLLMAVGCLVRSSRRQETLRLQASNHYTKPTPTPNPHAAAAAAAAVNGKNGKTMETLNPTFLMGPNDNGNAAANS
ncbi:Protein peste [Gryllus bimaculatus]|nr:Protein peste [Gryllus bimaculatus]